MTNYIKYLLIFIFYTTSCSNEAVVNSSKKGFTKVESSYSNLDFNNKIQESEELNPLFYDYYYNGAGVGAGDFDNDGLIDLFFAGNTTPSKIYRNTGALKFEDKTKASGIDLKEKWATGVTIIDINEDGYLDLYISCAGPSVLPNHSNELYINLGNFKFKEMSAEYGINDNGYSTHSCFLDFDNDGDLDLLVLNHTSYYISNMSNFYEILNGLEEADRYKNISHFYVNEDNKFSDKTKEFGLDHPSFALGISANDFNQDGYVDFYITNDFFLPDYYYINNKGQGFENKIKSFFKHSAYYSMGIDGADINNDGNLDIAVVDMTPQDHVRSKTNMPSMNVNHFESLKENYKYLPQFMFNNLQLNIGFGYYSDISLMTKTAKTEWSWAPLFADFTNDGNKDYFVTNGFRKDTRNNDWMDQLRSLNINELNPQKSKEYYRQLQKATSTPVPNYFYKNYGDLNFKEATESFGLDEASFSNGAAYADFDNDGDLDLVVNNIDKEALLYENHASENGNNYITFKLCKNKAIDLLNTKVKLHTDGKIQYIETNNVRGFMSSMEAEAHFGLGKINKVDSVEIVFPGNRKKVIYQPEINKKHIVFQDGKEKLKGLSKKAFRPLFNDVSAMQDQISYKHQENYFSDFKKEILLPHKQSTMGPFVSVGDVNSDGLEDFFVGGALGQSGEVYIQEKSGKFSKSQQVHLEDDSKFEDGGSIFFDFDKDGDQDLYVCSGGGADILPDSLLLQDRLYINNNGVFEKFKNELPKNLISASRVIAEDWDLDGDMDLFVCGRTNPGKYPLSVKSTFLRNEGDGFEDLTSSYNEEFLNLGMITDALWINLDEEPRKELVVVGEWSKIRIFKWEDDRLNDVSDKWGLENTNGWWYSINAGDFNNDGKMDLIAGNVGKNIKFSCSKEKPLLVYYNDFDNNGTGDIVLSNSYKDEYVPVRGRQCSSDQMPFLKDKFPTFSEFAQASIEEVYGDEELKASFELKAETFESIVLINSGDKFEVIKLNTLAQMSPINASIVQDFNLDGNLDVLIGGNMFNTEVETPSYDAGYGLLLLGKGDGNFDPILPRDLGVVLGKNLKDIKSIKLTSNNIPAFIIGNNNDKLQFVVNMIQ